MSSPASPVARFSSVSALMSTPWLYDQTVLPLLRQEPRSTPSLTSDEPFTMPVPWNHVQPLFARFRYVLSPEIRLCRAALSWM